MELDDDDRIGLCCDLKYSTRETFFCTAERLKKNLRDNKKKLVYGIIKVKLIAL